jgi:phosphatidylinositol alpha-1,6-mannosyltransferase
VKNENETKPGYILGLSTGWPPIVSGSGHAFKELVSSLPSLIVLVPRQSHKTGPNIYPVFTFATQVGGPFKLYSILQHFETLLVSLLWCLLSKWGRPELVLSHMPLFTGLSGWLIHHLWHVPYFVYAHGEELVIPLHQKSLRHHARLILTQIVLKDAAKIICNSRFTWRILQEHYHISAERLLLMHPTVSGHERYIDPRHVAAFRQALSPNQAMILMVGRLLPKKGFDRSIEALPLICKQYPDVRLVIAGPGEQTVLKSLARAQGVAKNVVLTGPLTRYQLLTLFAACDLFLLPSRVTGGDVEGFGIVFLEANIMGKPVIGGRTGGTEDAVVENETGLLVDGDKPVEIAEAVLRLLNDPSYAQQLGFQGQARVLKQFDSSIQQQQFQRIIEELLKRFLS